MTLFVVWAFRLVLGITLTNATLSRPSRPD
jgi:hypothetical protein